MTLSRLPSPYGAVAVTVMRVSRRSQLPGVFGDLYVQVFRNIPGIALLIIVVYALPPLKVVLPYCTYALSSPRSFGLGLWPRELYERHQHRRRRPGGSRRLLGMSFSRILAKIVIPQALRSSVGCP